jgi:hypothetical protein
MVLQDIAALLGRATSIDELVGGLLERVGSTEALTRLATGEELQAKLASFGDVGQLVSSLVRENARLSDQLEELTSSFQTFRPMKGRSPADWRFRVVRWDLHTMPIRPGDRVEEQLIPALRIWVPLEDKPDGTPYWDVTGSRIIALLTPLLPKVAAAGAFLHIVQHGAGPGSSYTVTVEAPSPTGQ